MSSIYHYLPFDREQASLIRSSLIQLLGLDEGSHEALVESYWQQIKAAAIEAQAAIELEKIDITKQKRAGQKLKRIAENPYPRYRHDTEIMALLYLGALRNGYIVNPPKVLNEKRYRSILFELSPEELRESAAEAYNAKLTAQSKLPIVSSDVGGRPNGQHYIDYAKSILAIYKAVSVASPNRELASENNDLTDVVFLEQCLSPSIFDNHPFVSTASLIENASI